MRPLVALLLVVGCGARGDGGPRWPAMHERENDGGEGLEPRTSTPVIAETKPVVDETKAASDTSAATTPTAATAATPATSTGSAAAPPATTPNPIDEAITIEGIVIEIDD